MARRPSTLPRALITSHVLKELKLQRMPVGDGKAPKETHGWGDNPPNSDLPDSAFIPYLVLTVGPAGPATGSIGDSSTEYEITYGISTVNVRRFLTETGADRLRAWLHGRERVSLLHHPDPEDQSLEERWRITQYRCPRIGAVQRVSSAFPDYYTQQDDVVVRVSKEK